MAGVTDQLQGMINATIARVVPGLVRGNDTALGTLVDRDVDGTTGRATFDPSSNPVPVKISGGLEVFEGDRVGMVRTGGFWMVVGCLSVRGMGETSVRGVGLSTGTTTSAVMADAAAITTLTGFRKFYSATSVKIQLMTGIRSTAIATIVELAARVTGTVYDGSAYDSGDLVVTRFVFNSVNVHFQIGGEIRLTTVQPGTYDVTPRWRLATGTATLTIDPNDYYNLQADEIRRQV